MQSYQPVTLDLDEFELVHAALMRSSEWQLAAKLQARADAPAPTAPTIRWEWREPSLFAVNGCEVPASGAGPAIAFLALAAARYRLGPPAVTLFKSGSGASIAVLNARDRAAERFRPMSPLLAACIDDLGTRKGVVAPRSQPPALIEFSSPWLERLAREVPVKIE